MKKRKRGLTLLLIICTFLLNGCRPSAASGTKSSETDSPLSSNSSISSASENTSNSQTDSEKEEEQALKQAVASTKAAKETDQIITVVSKKGSLAMITFFQKENDEWTQVVSTPGFIGATGMSDDKQEGDNATPTGIYTFGTAFGVSDNPGTKIPYLKLTKSDYWVDDSDSKYYNQLVNTDKTKKDWNSAEHLISETTAYNYAIAINYNTKCVPKKGSAIFFHCVSGASTAGCVSIPEDVLVRILTKMNKDTRIIIVKAQADLANY